MLERHRIFYSYLIYVQNFILPTIFYTFEDKSNYLIYLNGQVYSVLVTYINYL